MRALWPLAVVLLLLAGSLVASGKGVCPPGPPFNILRMVQDDAQSGGDAADCFLTPALLPPGEYHWATLDAADAEGLDGHDWFAGDLAAELGLGSWAMVNVTADILSYYTNYTVSTSLPELPVAMEVYAPGASQPFVTLHSCGVGAEFSVQAGLYLFHAYRPATASAAPCVDGAPYPTTEEAPKPHHNYGVYYGCKPHCFYVPG